MKRTVGVERSYFISDYNIIKPVDMLNEIPDEYALDQNFINKIRFIQLLDCDLVFKKYLILKGQIDTLSLKEAVAELERLKALQVDELNQILNKEN